MVFMEPQKQGDIPKPISKPPECYPTTKKPDEMDGHCSSGNSTQSAVVIQPQTVNNQESSLSTSHSFGDTWTLFLDVRKNRNVQWYGTSALIRGLDGNSILFAGAMR